MLLRKIISVRASVHLNRAVDKQFIVARGGFEPPPTASKAAVLPLDDRAFERRSIEHRSRE